MRIIVTCWLLILQRRLEMWLAFKQHEPCSMLMNTKAFELYNLIVQTRNEIQLWTHFSRFCRGFCEDLNHLRLIDIYWTCHFLRPLSGFLASASEVKKEIENISSRSIGVNWKWISDFTMKATTIRDSVSFLHLCAAFFDRMSGIRIRRRVLGKYSCRMSLSSRHSIKPEQSVGKNSRNKFVNFSSVCSFD